MLNGDIDLECVQIPIDAPLLVGESFVAEGQYLLLIGKVNFDFTL
jgi:hypothetical protein